MNFTNQIILSIASLSIAVILIVGVILISIALFKIHRVLKQRNYLLQQTSRPYIFCQKNQNRLEIRNIGQTPAIIDSITGLSSDSVHGQFIYQGQIIFYSLNNSSASTNIAINYHDQFNNYQSKFETSN